jgi:hypothetical protein
MFQVSQAGFPRAPSLRESVNCTLVQSPLMRADLARFKERGFYKVHLEPGKYSHE